jgi:hypothetical protein
MLVFPGEADGFVSSAGLVIGVFRFASPVEMPGLVFVVMSPVDFVSVIGIAVETSREAAGCSTVAVFLLALRRFREPKEKNPDFLFSSGFLSSLVWTESDGPVMFRGKLLDFSACPSTLASLLGLGLRLNILKKPFGFDFGVLFASASVVEGDLLF